MPARKEQPKKDTHTVFASTESDEARGNISRFQRSLGWVFDEHHPTRQVLVVAGILIGIVAGLLQIFVTFIPEPDIPRHEEESSIEERSIDEDKDDQKDGEFDLVPMPSFDLSTFPEFKVGRQIQKITTGISSFFLQRVSQGVASAMLFRGDQERYLHMRALHEESCSNTRPLTKQEIIKCESNMRLIQAISQSYVTMVHLICETRYLVSMLGSSNSLAELRENRSLADQLAEKYSQAIATNNLQFNTTRNSYRNAQLIGGLTSENLFENFFSQADPVWRESQRALRYGNSSPPKVSEDAHFRINQIRLMRSSISAELSELCRANNRSL